MFSESVQTALCSKNSFVISSIHTSNIAVFSTKKISYIVFRMMKCFCKNWRCSTLVSHKVEKESSWSLLTSSIFFLAISWYGIMYYQVPSKYIVYVLNTLYYYIAYVNETGSAHKYMSPPYTTQNRLNQIWILNHFCLNSWNFKHVFTCLNIGTAKRFEIRFLRFMNFSELYSNKNRITRILLQECITFFLRILWIKFLNIFYLQKKI